MGSRSFNIGNKLYRLVPKKVWLDNRLSLVQLERL